MQFMDGIILVKQEVGRINPFPNVNYLVGVEYVIHIYRKPSLIEIMCKFTILIVYPNPIRFNTPRFASERLPVGSERLTTRITVEFQLMAVPKPSRRAKVKGRNADEKI